MSDAGPTRRGWLASLVPAVLDTAAYLLVAPEGESDEGRTAVVDPGRCITFRGPECGACGALCPTEPQALTLRRSRPHIEASLCTGCGRCVEACPANPKGISMLKGVF